VPNGRNSGAKHEVAAFESVDAAVAGYFNNINKHNAYHMLRTIRAELRAKNHPLDAEILATGLLPYSERGADYVRDITNMLRQNQAYFVHSEDKAAAIERPIAM
jgi:Bax protein